MGIIAIILAFFFGAQTVTFCLAGAYEPAMYEAIVTVGFIFIAVARFAKWTL